MATIEPYDTKAGRRWRVRYRRPDRRQTDKRGFKTKRDAQAFAATVETSKLKGAYIDPTGGRTTIGELGKQWVNQLVSVRPQTITVYKTAFNTHILPTFGDTPIANITPATVRTWVASIDRGARTVRRAHHVLKSILDLAVQDGLITTNPAHGIALPKIPAPRRVYLTHQEVEQLQQHVPTDRQTQVYLAAYCGLRFGEIKAITADNISPRGTITIEETAVGHGFGPPKNGQPRTVGYPPFMRSMLLEAKLVGGRPFYQTPMPKNLDSWWKTAITKAGLPDLRFHDLRHTAASIAIASGASVKVVQNMLGHASAAMTLDVYAALWEEDVTKTAERIDAMRSREICGQNVGKRL